MADRLISEQAVLDEVSRWSGYLDDDMIMRISIGIKRLPNARTEVIRCKNCKYWFDIDDGRQKHRMCADLYGDWYCADAERRENG